MQANGEQPTALGKLRAAMPTDPRGWWIGEEVDRFIGTWQYLGLPELTLHDATGEVLTLWCADMRQAAQTLVLGDWIVSGAGFVIDQDDYQVCIVQADDK